MFSSSWAWDRQLTLGLVQHEGVGFTFMMVELLYGVVFFCSVLFCVCNRGCDVQTKNKSGGGAAQ